MGSRGKRGRAFPAVAQSSPSPPLPCRVYAAGLELTISGGIEKRNWVRDSMIAGVAVLGVLSLAAPPSGAQATAYRAPRTANGKPELSGIWQALNTADWNLEGQAAAAGPVPSLGAVFAKPPGLGVVEGDEIPYLPAMAAKKKENQANWTKLDPEVKCYLPGVPRATYLPYTFQI